MATMQASSQSPLPAPVGNTVFLPWNVFPYFPDESVGRPHHREFHSKTASGESGFCGTSKRTDAVMCLFVYHVRRVLRGCDSVEKRGLPYASYSMFRNMRATKQTGTVCSDFMPNLCDHRATREKRHKTSW